MNRSASLKSSFICYTSFFFTCIASLGFSNPTFLSEPESSSTVTLILAGIANEVYVINSSNLEPLILKIFNKKTVEEIKRSESLLQLVRDAGIRVPESIIPPLQIGSKVISVLSYANGHHIDDRNLEEVAKLMAKLHLIETTEAPLPPLKDYNRLFESCKNWKYCEELKKIFESLDLTYRDSLPRGIIHGDFSYTNLLVDEENNLTLLDFDQLRNDILLTDLVRCQLFYGFNQEGEFKEEPARSFILAYHNVRPLKAIEWDVFYTHMKLCLIEVALKTYDRMYVKKDLCETNENPDKIYLMPDLIAKQILGIKDKTSLILH